VPIEPGKRKVALLRGRGTKPVAESEGDPGGIRAFVVGGTYQNLEGRVAGAIWTAAGAGVDDLRVCGGGPRALTGVVRFPWVTIGKDRRTRNGG
jgi:hypothetical protein